MPLYLRKFLDLARNMGLRYFAFRLWYEIRRRSGWLKAAFPTAPPPPLGLPGLAAWRQSPAAFFFPSREALSFERCPSEALQEQAQKIKAGKFRFFHALEYDLGQHYDWLTNPNTGYRYNIEKHWTEIPDYSREAGDIKYVWEKARFAHLLTVIRYDYHFDEDNSAFLLSEIIDFIDKNPINQGPNYRCSQEISIRLMNWIFALYYYRNSPELSEERFQKIMASVYWQVHHVRRNILFSRIAVRNNHALTETLMLYLAGLLFPDIPAFRRWKEEGLRWFGQEAAYQIYEDGAFLQHSMNYHRVVVQLLTWALRLSEQNDESLPEVVYDRARKSLQFLYAFMDEPSGWLPNYGMNDGALFFPLNDNHFRDFRPQLQALEIALTGSTSLPELFEDTFWLNEPSNSPPTPSSTSQRINSSTSPLLNSSTSPLLNFSTSQLLNFPTGGYYLIREADTLSFLRCSRHRDRPHQADNLHLDIWYKGVNVLHDAGSFLYNTNERWIRYFNGSESHNTVMVEGEDQMLKGPRFVWYFWSQAKEARLWEEADAYHFQGSIHAFRQLGEGIIHQRAVKKAKGRPFWQITDTIKGMKNPLLCQLWHLNPGLQDRIIITAVDADGQAVRPEQREGWYAPLYGVKETAPQWQFTLKGNVITTEISINIS